MSQDRSTTTTPHTLHLGNLSFAIEEDDVRDFFKDVGEIAEIRFAIRDDRFLGYAHVQFTTAEAAQQALKLNNEVILDRQVKLDFARPRGAYTRGEGNKRNNECSMEKSNANQSGGTTVYVRGFDSTHGFDNIRSALEKHFGKCGEILRMSIPKDYESGGPRGVAFIEFADRKGFSQAMGLHGSEIGNGSGRLIVEEAKKQRVDCREGSGYGRDWRSESGSGNASSGNWVRENRSSRQSGSGIDWRSESGSSSSWHTESGSSSYWRRESGSSSTYWHRESGSNSGWGRETSFGSSSSGRGSGSSSSWHREYVSRRSGYCPGENLSSGGSGRLRDSGGGGFSSKQPYHPYR